MQKKTLNFIASGICCHSMLLVSELGVLRLLKSSKGCCLQSFFKKTSLKNPTAIQAALLSLEKLKIVERKKSRYYLTKFGCSLSDNIGLIKLLFQGYGSMFVNQSQLVLGSLKKPEDFFDGEAIAESSIQFSEETIIPKIISQIKKLKIKGSVCDFGCGAAVHLIKICNDLGLNGYGLDLDKKAVSLAKKNSKPFKNIRIIHKDLTKLDKVFNDVEVVMQCHVMHDIVPDSNCIKILNSTLTSFPNLKYFFFIDIVTSFDSEEPSMPGFDYVHGLQGIQTRTYEQTLKMFTKSKFQVVNELKIPSMPNTFFWTLEPKKL